MEWKRQTIKVPKKVWAEMKKLAVDASMPDYVYHSRVLATWVRLTKEKKGALDE